MNKYSEEYKELSGRLIEYIDSDSLTVVELRKIQNRLINSAMTYVGIDSGRTKAIYSNNIKKIINQIMKTFDN